MNFKPTLCLYLLFCLPFSGIAQSQPDTVTPPSKGRVISFSESGTTDADRVVLNVVIRDEEMGEPVLGATALLQRQEPEQVHGKITQWDGRCKFKVAPGTYNFRVQLTGLITFEQQNIELGAGKQYDMEIEMARLSQPVPSAKQQAGKN